MLRRGKENFPLRTLTLIIIGFTILWRMFCQRCASEFFSALLLLPYAIYFIGFYAPQGKILWSLRTNTDTKSSAHKTNNRSRNQHTSTETKCTPNPL